MAAGKRATAEQRAEWVRQVVEDGRPVAEVAREAGVSRQYVWRLMAAAGASRSPVAKSQALDQVLKAMAAARVCPVCAGWTIRLRYRTCSPECAEVWDKARLRLDPDAYLAHRRSAARSILRRPEKYSAAMVDHARRVLSPDPPPPNRRYEVSDSQATAAVDTIQGDTADD